MRIVVFGTYDVRRHPRVGVLAAGLAAAGDQIAECNVPLGFETEARVAMLRQPWRLPLLAWRLGTCWLRLTARSRSARSRAVRSADVVLVGYLGHFDVLLARALFRKKPIALDHLISASDTASDRGERGGVKQGLLRRLDRLATSSADVVVIDTDEHLDLLDEKARVKAVLAPVGATEEWFTARRAITDDAHDRPLRVIFFGNYIPLHGAPVIGRALALLPNGTVDALMVGHGQDLVATQRAAEGAAVEWVPWVEPEQLPQLVASYDVCLGIFDTGPKALRVVPNKVFQGAAAGCAIVTSDTPPQRRTLGDAAVYVPPGDAGALAAALLTLAKDRARLAELRRRAATTADARFTPVAVSAELRQRLLAATGAKVAA